MIDSTPSQVPARRRIFQRLMRRHGACVSSDSEAKALVDVLRSAPGADQIEVIGWHPKGGYRVGLTLVWSEFDAFIAHLEANNWMSVI
jgi:hypothetical protein